MKLKIHQRVVECHFWQSIGDRQPYRGLICPGSLITVGVHLLLLYIVEFHIVVHHSLALAGIVDT